VFGTETHEYAETSVSPNDFWLMSSWPESERARKFEGEKRQITSRLKVRISLLEEQLGDTAETAGTRALRACGALALHPEVARAASDRYRSGHYADAVEASVKALNNLVRLRSDEALDGISLMQKVFSPRSPILQFNELANQSDQDEQLGFMQMFSGAVSGLRNPRAHGFIQDDPERAREFIAFVSLLAKLLDGARKPPRAD
jgi:uncharacterized protein (TIGR02391 family)